MSVERLSRPPHADYTTSEQIPDAAAPHPARMEIHDEGPLHFLPDERTAEDLIQYTAGWIDALPYGAHIHLPSSKIEGRQCLILTHDDPKDLPQARAIADYLKSQDADAEIKRLAGWTIADRFADYLLFKLHGEQDLRLVLATIQAAPTIQEEAPHKPKGTPTGNGQHENDEEEDPPILVRPWPAVIDASLWHGLAGDYVAYVRPETESDPLAILVQFLVMFGNAVGRSPHMIVESTRHGCNENVLLVGRTSVGRKGTAADRAKAPFFLADSEWAERRCIGGLSTGEGLIYHVRDDIYKTEHRKEKGMVVETYEALADAGITDKRLMCMETEFSRVLRAIEREGNTLSAIIRQAWDGITLRVATRNNSLTATGPHVSIIGHCVGAELVRLLSTGEAASGFGNRFLYFAVKRSQLLPFGGEPLELDGFATALRDAIEFGRATERMHWTPEARRLWRGAYPDITQERAGLLGELTARNAAHVLRFAMIYSLLDHEREITDRAVAAALALVNQSTRSIKYIFGDVLGDPDADAIYTALEHAADKGLTRTDIRDLFQRNLSQTRITRALEYLVTYELASYQMELTKGRPRQRWFAGSAARGKSHPTT
jgi:hypothetical protein